MTDEPLPPMWLIHDPEKHRVTVDVPAAAAEGVQLLGFAYDSTTNTIQVATADKEKSA